MYCSTCGNPVANGLSYCKQCGANLVPAANMLTISDAPARRGSLALACLIGLAILMTAGVGLGGLAMVFIVMGELLRAGFPGPALMMLALFGLLTILGTIAVLGRQLSRLIDAYQPTPLRAKTSNSLLDAPPAPTPISVFREPASSITEHTTRTFETSHKEPRLS